MIAVRPLGESGSAFQLRTVPLSIELVSANVCSAVKQKCQERISTSANDPKSGQ